MSNDKMRAEFDAWFDGATHGTPNISIFDGWQSWQVWQAATAVCTDLLQAKDMEIHELKFCIDGELPLKVIIDAQVSEIARLTVYAEACEGITQDHLDGGWTAAGLSKYAKSLESDVTRLNAELTHAKAPVVEQEPVAWRIDMPGTQEFVDDLDDACDMLTNDDGIAVPLYEHPQPSADAALIRAAQRTRTDLGPSGENYPDVRALLAFAESAIEATKDKK